MPTVEGWARAIQAVIEAAESENLAVFASENEDGETWLYVGYRYPDQGDEDIEICEVTL